MKKLTSVLLAMVLAFGMLAGLPLTSTAETKPYVLTFTAPTTGRYRISYGYCISDRKDFHYESYAGGNVKCIFYYSHGAIVQLTAGKKYYMTNLFPGDKSRNGVFKAKDAIKNVDVKSIKVASPKNPYFIQESKKKNYFVSSPDNGFLEFEITYKDGTKEKVPVRTAFCVATGYTLECRVGNGKWKVENDFDGKWASLPLTLGKNTVQVRLKGTKIQTSFTVELLTPTQAKKRISVSFKSNKQLTLGVGEEHTRKGYVTPDKTVDKTVKYTSSDKTVATVNKNGKVIALKAGTTIIKAKSNGKTAKYTLVVKKAPKSVALKKATVNKGKKIDLTAILPKNAASNKMTWTSSNKKVATVDKTTGRVTAKRKGTTNITVTTFNGKTATCKVTVK
ncbi:MAG: Ig-like domain-containing protein [Oscillospiraceae bacterium]|nr:Ig-like domain-containing protein [Oscillospiraceae bacterium]